MSPGGLPPCYGVIPARWASSRFPGKPLADIWGKPMFWHVHARASRSPCLRKVVLATDDTRIADAAARLGVETVMTPPGCASGSDRVYKAAVSMGLDSIEPEPVVVNIQGDEPALDPAMIDSVVQPFADPAVRAATLAAPLDPAQASDPDRVKVVLDLAGNGLYFSRAAIPHFRNADGQPTCLVHVGLYAFRLSALAHFTSLSPSPLEQQEKLEQLRLLENGVPIRVVVTNCHSHGVDRPADLAVIKELLRENDLCAP